MSHENPKPTDRPRRARPWLQRLHENDRGNLGVLLLLTVWVLVGLIAMVWNTGEYATRRRHVQGAADSAAHAANVWVSRTTNLTASSNLVISENGSAEVILRSVIPTRTVIQARIEAERSRAGQLLDGSQPGAPEKNIPDCEYFEELLGTGAWNGNGRGDVRAKEFAALKPDVLRGMKLVVPLIPGPQAQQLQQRMDVGLRQNEAALEWIVGTYVGKAGTGTSGAGTVGVAAPVGSWISNDVRPRLMDILHTLDVEQNWLDQFSAQTDPAVNGMTPDQLRQMRQEIFEYQQEIRRLTPEVISEQRDALADFYKVEITDAVPGQRNDLPNPTDVNAPVKEAGDVPSETRVDSIRQRYPQATLARFQTTSPSVTIDPINVNVGDSIIWHPGTSVSAQGNLTLAGQSFTGTFHIGGGDWGRVPCAPLSGYINNRVSRDRQALRREPQAIDSARDGLRGDIYPPPAPPSIDTLPTTIGGTGADAIPLPPRRLPTLPSPAVLSAADQEFIANVNARISQFDTDMRNYVRDLRGLQQSLSRMYSNLTTLSDHASTRFADGTWLRYVEQNRDFVLREIGWDKTFMVMTTYQLRQIPDWAVSGMRQSVQDYVYRVIYSRNIGPVTRAVRSQLQRWALGALNSQSSGPGGGGKGNNQSAANQFASRYASSVAADVVRRGARIIAEEVADEWVQRPWPFEIDPPQEAVPPTRGITDDERKQYFTSLFAAVTTDDTSPRPLLPQMFTSAKKAPPMVAFAQGETFNWMEYDESYGAGARYDQITWYGHGDMGGSPRPWRISTTGGWNWQSRLAYSDAVGQAYEDGADFSDFMQKGGVTSHGDDANQAIQKLTHH